MYLSKCIIERSRVSAYFPRALSFFLLQRRDTNNELSFCITSSFPLPIATESFPSNLSRSECLSKPLRSVRFEPYFPSSVSPRRLESRPWIPASLDFPWIRVALESPTVSTSSPSLSFRALPSSPFLFVLSQKNLFARRLSPKSLSKLLSSLSLSLSLLKVLSWLMFWQKLQLQRDDKQKQTEQMKREKKRKSKKKNSPKNLPLFLFSLRNSTRNNTLVRVLRDISCLFLSRRRRRRSKGRAFLLVPLKSGYLRRRKKTKDDGVDFLRVVVVQFRRHPKKGATT